MVRPVLRRPFDCGSDSEVVQSEAPGAIAEPFFASGDNFPICRSITLPVPAALPLWVIAYALGIWGFASLNVSWAASRWVMGGALLGLSLGCLRDRGKGSWLLLCALALGGLAQARRSPALEIPALTSLAAQDASGAAIDGIALSELLASPELAPDTQWLCLGRVTEAATATAQGVSLRIEVTALRRAAQAPQTAWLTVSPPLRVAVNVRGAPREALWPGTPVRLSATLRSPRAAQNPGAGDRLRHAAAVGIEALASVDPDELFPWHGPLLETQPQAPLQTASLWLTRRIARLRARMLEQILRAPSAVSSGSASLSARGGRAVVSALVLGERGPLLQVDRERQAQALPTIADSFRGAGIYHVLSVSGLHLAVVAWICYRLLAWLLLCLPWPAGHRVARRGAALSAVPPTLFYALLTGAELATQRAALAAALSLLAIRCGRRATLSQSLAGAVLVIAFPAAGEGTAALLLCEPALLLSIAATLGIAYLRPLGGLPRRWLAQSDLNGEPGSLLRRVAGALRRSLFRLVESSLAAMLATAPICAYCFAELQVAGVLGNLIPGVLGEVVVLPLGLIGVLMGLGWTKVGGLLLAAAAAAGQAMVRSAAAIAGFAGVVPVKAPSAILAVLFWLGLGLAAGAGGEPRPRSRRLGVCICGLAVALYLLFWRLPSHALRVTVLDVGQGDAIVVELPAGGVMVVDAGLQSAAGIDMGARVVVPFLRQRGYRRIDLLVASHPHPDHIGGLAALVDNFPVDELWGVPAATGGEVGDGEPTAGDQEEGTRIEAKVSARAQGDPSWLQLLRLARQHGIAITTPRSRRWQGVELTVLAPCRRDPGGECSVAVHPGWSPNDNSIVLRLGYAGRSVLLPGDIELAGELALLSRNADGSRDAAALQVDVLKAPHHCSQTSSSESFVAAVQPKWVICSLGAYNRYRFPHEVVYRRYKLAGSRVLRTDADGAVELRIDSAGHLHLESFAAPPQP